MRLHPGSRVGQYEIQDAIGAGGMGEVYRAFDPELRRSVALKVLAGRFLSDADRVARFEREAMLLASVSHPNIAQIYGVVHGADDVRGLAMEFVDGVDLADRIGLGPLSTAEALQIARQVAAALEAAHEIGIVHRDLKPANVKVRSDGVVKVLDFGVARPSAARASGVAGAMGAEAAPTETALTERGAILGTAAYMSPEQASGRAVDRRTDIWALGCLMFEMLTGARPFTGTNVAETTSAIMRDEPDWNALPAAVPLPIRRLLKRCLEKERGRRLDSAAVVRLELEDALDGTSDAGSVDSTSRRRVRRWQLVSAAAMVLAAGAIAAAVWLAQRPASASEVRLDITTPPAADPYSFALSPDGTRIVFVAGGYDAPLQLFVRTFDNPVATPVPNTDGAIYPFWSPDGKSVGFFANGKLRRVNIDGSSSMVLAEAGAGRGGSWNRSGQILYTQNATGPLSIAAADASGSPRTLTTLRSGETAHLNPVWHPDGRRFFYFLQAADPERRGVYVATVDHPEAARRVLTADGGAQFRQPGHLVFVRDTTLFVQPFDDASNAVTGSPVEVAAPLPSVSGRSAFSVCDSGPLAYRSGKNSGAQLRWFSRAGAPEDAFGNPDLNSPLGPMLSPSGSRVVIRRSTASNDDVWMLDRNRAAPTRLTSDPAPDIFPVWSPDESQVVFRSTRGATLDVYQTSATGLGGDSLVMRATDVDPDAFGLVPTDWSKDGRWLMTYLNKLRGTRDLWVLPMAPTRGKPRVYVATRYDESNGRFSPDGRWVLYQTNETGRFEIAVRAFPAGERVWQVSTGGGVHGRWRRDGRELYFVAPDGRLMGARVDGSGQGFQAEAPVPLFAPRFSESPSANPFSAQYDVGSDGRFLINVTLDEVASAPITLILNWREPR